MKALIQRVGQAIVEVDGFMRKERQLDFILLNEVCGIGMSDQLHL